MRVDHDRRRRVLEADHPGLRRGRRARRAVRHVVAQDDRLVGRDVDDGGQGGAARPDPAGGAHRRDRFDRGLDRQPGHDARASPPRPPSSPATRPPRCSTEDDREVAPGSDEIGIGRRRRARADRLLQGPGEVGPDVPRDRRRALLVPRRHGQGRRRRLADPARPRQPGDQLRRREGLPGGGRGGRQARRRRRRLPRRRRRRRTFGQAVTAVVSLAGRRRRRRGRRSSPA